MPEYRLHHDSIRAQVAEVIGAAALCEHQRALALLEQRFGPDHLETAASLNNLGIMEGRQGRYADARRHLERSLAIQSRARGPDHPTLAFSLTNLGLVYEGRGAEALQAAERALHIRQTGGVPEDKLAVHQFLLARALAAMHREPARARELARRARDGFARGGAATRAKLAEVDRWLDTHGR